MLPLNKIYCGKELMKPLPEIITDYMERNNYVKPYLLSRAFCGTSTYNQFIVKMLSGKLVHDTKRARAFLAFIEIPEDEIANYLKHNEWRKKDKPLINPNFEICPACRRQTLDKGCCMAITYPRCNYGFDKTKGLLEGNIARGFDGAHGVNKF